LPLGKYFLASVKALVVSLVWRMILVACGSVW